MGEIKWKSSERVQKKYIENKEGKYYQIELGVQKVNPQKIVALSRTIDDTKLERLRKNVEEEGWVDKNPAGILLWKLPNSKYVVSGEGNHRAFYCRTEGIKEIEATVSLIVDMSKLTEQQQTLILEKQNDYFSAYQKYMDSDDSNQDEKLLKLLGEADKERFKLFKTLKLVK